MTFGFAAWAGWITWPALLKPWNTQSSPLHVDEIGHGDPEFARQLEEDCQARVSFSSFNLLEVPKGYRSDLFLSLPRKVARPSDVGADQFSKRGKLHARRFPVDWTVNPTTIMGPIRMWARTVSQS